MTVSASTEKFPEKSVSTEEASSTKELTGQAIIRELVGKMGTESGVYRMLGEGGEVLYVGKARNLRARVQSYTNLKQLSRRIALMVSLTRSMETITTHTEAEALLLEAELIKRLKPRFNILLRDDKSYPEILLNTEHPYPRLMKHRGKRKSRGQYFGPYANVRAVNIALDELQKSFLLRTCTDQVFAHRTRPCLLYEMKRCCAPCVSRVSEDEYQLLMHQAQNFLQGKTAHVQAELAVLMQEASASMLYEKASEIRDRLAAMTAMQKHYKLRVPHERSCDVMALAIGERRSCVFVYLFRQGRHCGSQAYFVSHAEEVTSQLRDTTDGGDNPGNTSTEQEQKLAQRGAEILASFIGQFYQKRDIPHLLLLDQWPTNAPLLSEALRRHSGHALQMSVPQRGEKHGLVSHALAEARDALNKRQVEGDHYRKQWQNFADLIGLENLSRIEVFDNSHLSGTNPVGVMVVLDREGFARQFYRKFNIRGDYAAGDDYAFMREVLDRRLAHLQDQDAPRPDLLLVDGGRGQLKVAQEVLVAHGLTEDIALGSVVKGPGRNLRQDRLLYAGQDFSLAQHNDVGLLIQRMRDEAHRFAIGAQRTRRKQDIQRSPLDGIPSIGAKRKKRLLLHFGSAKAVAEAGVADIAAVEGMSWSLAEGVYQHFRS